jgi:uncharacterized protein YwlG (UPF0340 family)
MIKLNIKQMAEAADAANKIEAMKAMKASMEGEKVTLNASIAGHSMALGMNLKNMQVDKGVVDDHIDAKIAEHTSTLAALGIELVPVPKPTPEAEA